MFSLAWHFFLAPTYTCPRTLVISELERLCELFYFRARSSSIIAQKRLRSSSALAAKGDEKKESSSLAKEGTSEVTTATTKGPGSIALDVPTDKARPWKTELFSPTTEQMSESPVVGSLIPVGSIAEETAAEAMREEMDKEDEERFAAATTTTTAMTEKEDQRNAMTLSEELGMTTGQSEVTVDEEEEAETNEVEEGDDFFHCKMRWCTRYSILYSPSLADEINRLRNEKEEVENQRCAISRRFYRRSYSFWFYKASTGFAEGRTQSQSR